MRTDPKEDPVVSAGRRLDELSRLWASDDPADPSTSMLTSPPASGSGRHAVDRPSRAVSGYGTALRLVPRHLLLIVVAGVVFVLLAILWTARGAADPMPVADTKPAAASVAPSPSPPTLLQRPRRAAPTVVVVDVAGKVRRPLVATLPVGSRVVDAIRKAGGPRPGVDLSVLNLARILVDGEQILVGAPARPTFPHASGATPGATAGSAPGSGAGKTNLNSATAAQLEELPGVGPVTAQKIVDWRTENGAFSSAEELLEVDGIGPKTLAEIAPEVTW